MKKIVSIIICALMITAVTVTAFAETDEVITTVGVILKGDINGDGEANNKDVVELFRYASGNKKADDETAYDFNGDKEVNNKDVVELFRYLSSGQTGEPAGSEQSSDDTGAEEPGTKLTYVDADVYADAATAEKEGFKKATDAEICKWFDGKTDMDMETFELVYLLPEAFDYVEGFVMRKAKNQYIEEVTVFKVKEGGSVESVAKMAEARCEKQKNNGDYKLYDDDDHRNAKMLDTGVVKIIGDYVVYAVTIDTEASIKRAENYAASHPGCSAAELYKAIVVEEYGK